MTFQELNTSLILGLIYGIAALGIYLTFRVLKVSDLTCDGSFVLGACTSTVLIKAGWAVWISLGAAIIMGFLAGATTSFLHHRLKVSDLLAGIIVSFSLYSINLRIMGGLPNIALIQDTFLSTNPLMKMIFLSAIAGVIVAYVLQTDWGLALRSVGHNEKLAQHNGVNTKWMRCSGFAISNSLLAFSGALLSHYQSFADVGSGIGTIIVGLASVMIGEKILASRHLSIQVLGCLVGSVVYRLFMGAALHSQAIGLKAYDLNLVTGVLMVGIMAFGRRKKC